MANINEHAMGAAKKYLQLTGREIIDVFDDIIAYYDEDDVALGKVIITREVIDDVTYDNRMSRDEFEHVAWQVIYNYSEEIADVNLRADLIEMFIVKDNRAMIRHTIDAEVADI